MSLPTRIYLVACAILLALWLGFLAGVEREAPPYASDPGYFIAHSGDLTEALRGRVVFDAPPARTGGQRAVMRVPEGALVVRVRAVDLDESVAVERTAPVGPNGDFEVRGLPRGSADVAVMLGGGADLVEVRGVFVDGAMAGGDPRLDPIDLGALVAPYEITLRGPAGTASLDGHLAWRPAAMTLEGDGEPFVGLARVEAGRARFLATTDRVDVVPLLPGVRREVEPWVADGGEIRVGVGAIADLVASGSRPDPRAWRVLAHLEPIESASRDLGALVGPAAGAVPRHATGELDGEGRARIPLVAEGPHVLRWFVSRAGVEITGTIRIEDPAGAFELAPTGGVQMVERAFPMDEFLARLSARE